MSGLRIVGHSSKISNRTVLWLGLLFISLMSFAFLIHNRLCLRMTNGVGNKKQFMPIAYTKIKPAISQQQKAFVLNLLQRLLVVAYEEDFTHWLHGGTLLGSWRHHGIIPWDDDIDLYFHYKDRDKLLSALRRVESPYRVSVGHVANLKFWSKESNISTGKEWTWPYVDILFFEHNEKEVWEVKKTYVRYKMDDTFPLHKRPFEGLWINAPHNPPLTLKSQYPDIPSGQCQTVWEYDHKQETKRTTDRGGNTEKTSRMGCLQLRDVVPFVHRRIVNSVMEETLKLGDEVIQTVVVPDESYKHLTSPYDYAPLPVVSKPKFRTIWE